MDTKNVLDILFSHFFATNVYYGTFRKVLKDFLNFYMSFNKINYQNIIMYYK